MPHTESETEAVVETTRAVAAALKLLRDARARVSTLRQITHPNKHVESCHSLLTIGVAQLEELRDVVVYDNSNDAEGEAG